MSGNNKLQMARQMLESAEHSLAAAQKILAELVGVPAPSLKAKEVFRPDVPVDGKVVEGVFDGQNMVGPDGKTYSVPANYASKSKLVDGDTLKLTIADDGTFIYKQIGPVERKRAIGKLVRDPLSDEFMIDVNGVSMKVLRASVTYFKGEVGDQIVVLLPKNTESKWVAVENIIKAGTPFDPDSITQPENDTSEEDEILGTA